jgi:hypothetical protein
MKKILFITIILMIFLLSSCKKDASVTDPLNLSGTSWLSDNTGTSSQPEYVMLKFTSKTTVEIWGKLFGESTFTKGFTGTYAISANQITLNFADGTIKGTIDGNTMTYIDNGDTTKFTKQ